ncbi:MAG TPA: exodeoxyribonuclease VII small subunit [Ruminiclostridium sp.]|nr:exodeoxyribonuclease VII small subunit [Ruminiclostridium sp.]
MKNDKKDMTFEKAISRLEEIISLLEDGGAPLDETMALYAEGAKLAAVCSEKLEKAEQIVKKADGAKSNLKDDNLDD